MGLNLDSPEWRFDKRLAARHLRSGVITLQEYQAHLESLEDVAQFAHMFGEESSNDGQEKLSRLATTQRMAALERRARPVSSDHNAVIDPTELEDAEDEEEDGEEEEDEDEDEEDDE